MGDHSTIRIDRDALESNLRAIAVHCGGGPERICAVVKADAYGLGAPRIAHAMEEFGIDGFAAYGPAEAIDVANATRGAWVLVLMPVDELGRDPRSVGLLGEGRLHHTAHDLDQVRSLERDAAALGIVLPLHLELDTGMGRGGCDPVEARAIVEHVAASPRLRLAGVMTHFPDAVEDPISAGQRGRVLRAFLEEVGPLVPDDVIRHAAATASLEVGSTHLDRVRVGIGWIGLGSSALAGRPDPVPLSPIVSWSSSVIRTRRIPAGRTIGYGCHARTTRETITGIVPVGYGDGLPTAIEGESHLAVVHAEQGAFVVPVLGRMNMDQCVLDLTDVAGGSSGLPVELVSADADSAVSLERVAARAGISPYQLLCGMAPRSPRLLVAGGSFAISRLPEVDASGSPPRSRRLEG